jgi:hypothetical protein
MNHTMQRNPSTNAALCNRGMWLCVTESQAEAERLHAAHLATEQAQPTHTPNFG